MVKSEGRSAGALAVAIPACPVIKSLELAGCTKLTGLYVARLVLVSSSFLILQHVQACQLFPVLSEICNCENDSVCPFSVQATFSLLGLLRLRYAIQQTLGRLVGNAFVLLTCTQFHLLFYAGRPLPNTFAFPLVSSAVAAWMLGQQVDSVIALLAFMTVCLLTPCLARQCRLLRAVTLANMISTSPRSEARNRLSCSPCSWL